MLRQAAGLTQAQLAEAMGGVHWTTVSELERGRQALTEKWMRRIAQVLQVPPSALLNDDDSGVRSIPMLGRVEVGGKVEQLNLRDGSGVTLHLPFSVPPDASGYVVRGEALLPRYGDGDIIICLNNIRRSSKHYLNQEAFIRVADGSIYLRTLTHMKPRGFFSLELFNSRTIEDVQVIWIGQIFAIVRAFPDQAKS